MKKKQGSVIGAGINTKVNNRAALNAERKAMKLMKDHEKQSKRKTTPRGTARSKKRRSLRALYTQDHHQAA